MRLHFTCVAVIGDIRTSSRGMETIPCAIEAFIDVRVDCMQH